MVSSFVIEASKDVVTDDGTFRVTRRMNALTGEVRYAAFERLTQLGSHNRFEREDEGWRGNVSERKLSGELDKQFEGRRERRAAVEAFYKANRELARSLIVTAFPEASQGTRIIGAIVLSLNQLPDTVRAQIAEGNRPLVGRAGLP